MREAARAFVGMRDFRAFAVAAARGDEDAPPSTLVLVDEIEIVEQGELILVSVQGSHFLWKMVRRMVGVLVEIGRGALPPDAIGAMLAEGSTAPARLTAPPSGLFLEKVFYEPVTPRSTGAPPTRTPRTRRTTSS
jgi:tRNA pseudouridine38-40 synthase